MRGWGFRRIALTALGCFAVLASASAFVWREDILRNGLDPKIPYQTYKPTRAPDYAQRRAWVLLPTRPDRIAATDPSADVFFVHPTTYDGGEHWNAPLRQDQSERALQRVMLPNYAGPFARVGRIFAPRYRQASLYTQLTLREDARDARAFAYADVAQAFRYYLAHYDRGRPLILAGVEQGGLLVSRLAREAAADPALKGRIVAVYMIDTVVPAADFGPQSPLPACASRLQAGCVLAWRQRVEDGPRPDDDPFYRAVVWTPEGRLVGLGDQPILCVNPLLGGASNQPAPARQNLGAANATGLEWGARPAFLSRQVSAQCVGGVLVVSEPKSSSLRPSGSWSDRRKVPGYNLFYADIEADAQARVAARIGGSGILAPPIEGSIAVKPSPIHRIN
jgi:hypothetical protein